MRHLSFSGLALFVLAVVALAVPAHAQAQEQAQAPAQAPAQELPVPHVSDEKLELYASAYTEIGTVRDQYHAQFARTANKTGEIQAELRKKLREEVHKIIESKGLTQEEYDRITWVISVDPKQMEAFQQVLTKQRGGAPRS